LDNLNLRLLFVFTDLLLPLIVGYFLHQKHLISDAAITKIIRFNVIFVYTLLSLLSFWVLPLNFSLIWAPICGFLLVLVPGAVGLPFARRFPNLLDRGAFISSAMLSNLGTLGGVCAFILYNEPGFAYCQLAGTCQNILLCLVVFPMAEYYYIKQSGKQQKTSRLQSLREMFLSPNQLSLLGMAAGLALNAAGIERPAFLSVVFQSFVHIGAWIAMLPVGFLINFHQVKRYAHDVRSLNIIHFVISPLFFYMLTGLVIDDPVLRGSLMILSICPTAINAVIACKLYHLTVDLAISSFVITTAIFFAIFPFLFFLLR